MPIRTNTVPLAAKIIFLDFDGVLQTPSLEGWQDMEHTAALEDFLENHPDVKVVVTSTHREGKSLADLQALLPLGIARHLVGATPVCALGRANGGRQAEIETWLSAHSGVTQWAAVDDEVHLFRDECPWLVATHRLIGWTEITTSQLQEQLFGGLATEQHRNSKCTEPMQCNAAVSTI